MYMYWVVCFLENYCVIIIVSESLPLEDVKITFLPLNCLPDLQKKSKYPNTFHMVYFANR